MRTGSVHAATARTRQPYLVRYRKMDLWTSPQERRGRVPRNGRRRPSGAPKVCAAFCQFRLGRAGLERQTLYGSGLLFGTLTRCSGGPRDPRPSTCIQVNDLVSRSRMRNRGRAWPRGISRGARLPPREIRDPVVPWPGPYLRPRPNTFHCVIDPCLRFGA